MSGPDTDDERIAERWVATTFTVGGIVAVLAGIAVFVLPHATLTAIIWVFAAYLVVAGVVLVARGASPRSGVDSGWRRAGLVVVGVLVVAGGFIAFATPSFGVRLLSFVIGVGWIVEGIGFMYEPSDRRVFGLVAGVVCVIAGLVALNLPFVGAAISILLLGVMLVVIGIVQLAAAISIRRATRPTAAA